MRWLALGLLGATACQEPVIRVGGNPLDADGDGFTSAEGDCDDADATVFPGAWDSVGDDKDQNCDGIDGEDRDNDGVAWTGSGGEDCDDEDPTQNPEAEDIGWDGIDQDCDGEDRHDFVQVCAGAEHSCGIDTTGRVRCWGAQDERTFSTPPPDGREWTSLDCSQDATCAVNESGELACWGLEDPKEGLILSNAPVSITGWRTVHMGWHHACARDGAGSTTCWGSDVYSQLSSFPVGAQFQDLGLGRAHTCGIRSSDGSVLCWGDEPGLVAVTPSPAFFVNWVGVAGGDGVACGIRFDLSRDCWADISDAQDQQLLSNEAGPWRQLTIGSSFVCGIKDSELSCVGRENPFGVLASVPEAPMKFVDAGHDHACAVREWDGEVECWGRDDDGQATVPDWPNVPFTNPAE